MRTTTTNRPTERRHIQETSSIGGIPLGRTITADNQRIIEAHSRLEDLYLDYDSEGQRRLNIQISKDKYPGEIVAIGPKGGKSQFFNYDMGEKGIGKSAFLCAFIASFLVNWIGGMAVWKVTFSMAAVHETQTLFCVSVRC